MEIDQNGSDGADASLDTSTQALEQSTTQAPTPLELADDALIKVKGSDKPVKFGDHVRGFQSQFTKASQRAAQLERQLQERETRLQQLEQERQAAARQQQAGGQGDIYESLRQLPYLDGETAVKVVQGIAGQIQQRDQILLGALNQLKSLQGVVQQLHQTHVGSSFEQKIDKWFGDNGWDPAFKDLAKEVYLAYEGDDLDVEFPNIFSNRLSAIEKAIEARKSAAVQKAKQNRFVPGKGGVTGPSKPLEFKGDASAKDIADQLWNQFQGSDT
jgi:hypothetical protein